VTARQRRKARRASCWRIDYASSVLTEAFFVQALERSGISLRRVEACAVEPVIVIERVRL